MRRIALSDKSKNSWRFGQNALIGDQRRHPALWIDAKIGVLTLFTAGKINFNGLIVCPDIF